MEKVLFILKKRESYWGFAQYGKSSGLYWSATFVHEMLKHNGVRSHLVEVTDNNDIDREVTNYRPTIVIIEALWVVPEKFDVLKKLHPNVKWVVRLHSNLPFLAHEGIALDWIFGYAIRDVRIAVNDSRLYDDLVALWGPNIIIFLPNYYPVQKTPYTKSHHHALHIGCYGAIRPLKNQLQQAISAIRFADEIGKTLFFHVNSTRIETGGDPVLRNIKALFESTEHHLVEDAWMSHHEFLEKLRHIDIGMQVSLSETFSIVAADMVSTGVPIVTSSEIKWSSYISHANPVEPQSIIDALYRADRFPGLNVRLNRRNLQRSNRQVVKDWLVYTA